MDLKRPENARENRRKSTNIGSKWLETGQFASGGSASSPPKKPVKKAAKSRATPAASEVKTKWLGDRDLEENAL